MPWNTSDAVAQRRAFVNAALRRTESFAALCRRFGISRQVGYRWRDRFLKEGEQGLQDRPRVAQRPRGRAGRQRWEAAVLKLRRRQPLWGPRKLRAELRRQARRAQLPSERTIARWLCAHDLVRAPRRRSLRGPAVQPPARTVARRVHAVWTIDFKGDIRTGDGMRLRPLTVRDQFSRYLLMVRVLPQTTGEAVRAALRECFGRYGLPRVIRVDNGPPFGRTGALGLSKLSAWWLRLGIQVEFSRRGCPQDNGAHEQMHRVMKAHTARPPAATAEQQLRRLQNFRRYYNERRPHEALGQRTPAQVFRPNTRLYAEPRPLRYPAQMQTVVLAENGKLFWLGRQRRIGEAFAGELLGLKPQQAASARPREEVIAVYWGRQLIGELHAHDQTDLRPAYWVQSGKSR